MSDYLTNLFTNPPIGMTMDQCAAVITRTTQDTLIPLTGFLVFFAIAAVVFAVLWALETKERKYMRDFLRREDKLNKYENWKKDRQLMQE